MNSPKNLMDLYLLPENTACSVPKSSLKLKVTKHHSWRNFRRFLFVAYRQKSGSWVSKKNLCTHLQTLKLHYEFQLKKNQHIIRENALAIWLLESACKCLLCIFVTKTSNFDKISRFFATLCQSFVCIVMSSSLSA